MIHTTKIQLIICSLFITASTPQLLITMSEQPSPTRKSATIKFLTTSSWHFDQRLFFAPHVQCNKKRCAINTSSSVTPMENPIPPIILLSYALDTSPERRKIPIESLIKDVADVNAQVEGGSLLHQAIFLNQSRDNLNDIEALLSCGVNVNAKNTKGLRPLDNASKPETIKLLKSYGAKSSISSVQSLNEEMARILSTFAKQ